MSRAVLALNAGSSSIKFALSEVADRDAKRIAGGEIESIGTEPHFLARNAEAEIIDERRWGRDAVPSRADLLGVLLQWVETHLGPNTLVAVGHRVVHGGRDLNKPVLLTDEIIQRLEGLTPLAPLHQPYSLEPVRAIMTLRPGLPQVGCFDTAFHHAMPAVATRLALPRDYDTEGVRRYGFHGLSYEYITGRLRETCRHLASGRVIVAHLGNGASLCAMRDGHSVDTTMGFTALDGLMMGTRCGTIDPGVLLYMLQQKGLSPDEVEDVLYKQSGLLGVSGLSSDMRTLLTRDDPHSREAVDLFVYRIAQEAAALAGALGGLDGFVFTAGIGEHSAEIRAAVCERLHWLGVISDEEANMRHANRISTVDSRVDVRVIPTDEEAIIIRHTLEVLNLPVAAAQPIPNA